MIKKEKKLIITFKTTSAAMAMEKQCRNSGIEGRLIPVPKDISAGCGMAWSAAPEREKELTDFMRENGIIYEGIQLCVI